MDFNFMAAQLEDEVELPVDENVSDNEVVIPEEDPAVQTAEIEAEGEQIELYCQSIRALMDEVYCVNSTISRYGETGARMAARLFPNAPVEMLIAGQEGFKEVLKKIWDYICKLWKKVVNFISKVFSRIFSRRNAADEWTKWERAYKQWYQKFSENAKSYSHTIRTTVEVYDPKEANTYAKRLQAKLQHNFNITSVIRPAGDLLNLLKSSNKSADSLLQDIKKIRDETFAIGEKIKDEKSLNAEALHQIKKTRIKLTPDNLHQVRKDLDPLMSAQLRIQGWKSDCDKVLDVAQEIVYQAQKRAQAASTDEEVKVAREIAKTSTDLANYVTVIAVLIADVYRSVNKILDSYLKPIREVAEKLAKMYGQAF